MNDPHDHYVLLLNADLDGELDAGQSADLAQHVATCAECTKLRAELSELSGRLRADLPYHPAPALLRARLARRTRMALPAALVAASLAAGLAFLLLPAPLTDGDLIAAHLRALQPGHLTDVASNDQHNVKLWFDGRLDYVPPVRDLAGQGFPLSGGRLDYLQGRPIAALVYRRQNHVIDVFVRPQEQLSFRPEPSGKGYQTVAWNQDGFAFIAISDLNATELAQFASAFQAAR
jgi:anti-sigma factor RsiW